MEKGWYYMVNGQRVGPVSPEILKHLAETGRLLPTEMVWKEGMTRWAAAKKLKGLFPANKTAAGMVSPPPTLPAVQPATKESVPESVQQVQKDRPCEWCKNAMPVSAVACPRCG